MCKTKRGLTRRSKIGKVKSERLRFVEFSKSMACVYKYFLELYIFLLIIEKKNLRRNSSIVKQYVYVCAYCNYVSKLCSLYPLIWSSRNLKKNFSSKNCKCVFYLSSMRIYTNVCFTCERPCQHKSPKLCPDSQLRSCAILHVLLT